MKQTLTIPGRLPGMNEIISASKTLVYRQGKARIYQYTQDKDHFGGKIAQLCALQRLKPVAAVQLSITFKEKRLARDPDNIIAGIKFILDGLVKADILKDDSFQYVKGLAFSFEAACDDNSIEVVLEGR